MFGDGGGFDTLQATRQKPGLEASGDSFHMVDQLPTITFFLRSQPAEFGDREYVNPHETAEFSYS